MQAPPLPPNQKNSNSVLWIVLGVVAVCGCGGVAVMAAILFPVFAQAKFAAKKTASLSNLRHSASAAQMYAADWDDRLPQGTKWVDLLESYTKNPGAFKSLALTDKEPNGYGFAFRKDLSSKSMASISDPERWAMIFDSTITTRNACSNLETLPQPGRYMKSNLFGFLDGSARAIKDEALSHTYPDGKPMIR